MESKLLGEVSCWLIVGEPRKQHPIRSGMTSHGGHPHKAVVTVTDARKASHGANGWRLVHVRARAVRERREVRRGREACQRAGGGPPRRAAG